MNATAVKPKEQLCQADFRAWMNPATKALSNTVRAAVNGICRAQFPDPDWHPCARRTGRGLIRWRFLRQMAHWDCTAVTARILDGGARLR